ncbi:MAG: pyridoxal-phosphate dependent enzyme, partial [Acidimicrobiales bacterium]
VEPLGADSMLKSVQADHVVVLPGIQDSIMAGLNCGTPSRLAWPLVSRGFTEFVAIKDERARQGMRELALLGIVAGETGAAALGGLFELCSDEGALSRRAASGLTADSSVLVICTEGATDPRAYEEIVGYPPGSLGRSCPKSKAGIRLSERK